MDKFLKNVTDYKLIENGDKVFACVSGGADSIFMLNKLYDLKKSLSYDLFVLHFNHKLRDEADSDEAFVRDRCKELGLEFYSSSALVGAYAKENKISEEEAGRHLRYKFFYEMAAADAKIALAHNRDDQAETVLQRIIRGSGLDGLVGMEFKKGRIIRPILNFYRKEIEDYLSENGLSYVIDKTNLLPIYGRNKVRLKVLPMLEDLNPQVKDALVRLSENAREDVRFLDAYCLKRYEILLDAEGLDTSEFLKEDPSIQRRIIKLYLSDIFKIKEGFYKIHYNLILKFIKEDGLGSLDLPAGLELVKSYKHFYFSKKKIEKNFDFEEIFLKNGFNKTDLGNFIIEEKNGTPSKESIFIDKDKISGDLRLRTRKIGDKFSPLGLCGSKKLKDFFIDKKIPREARNKWPLICDEKKIVWVVGLSISDRVKLDKKSKNILNIRRDYERKH